VTKEEERTAGSRRFSVQRKMAVVARLQRGEPLELVARETNVSIHRLTEWRDRALAGAASALKERACDDRDDEIARLKAKVGEITMANELLYAICGRPRMASFFLALRTI
jgi:transposase